MPLAPPVSTERVSVKSKPMCIAFPPPWDGLDIATG